MAKPIKDTPVLRGDDARRFLTLVEREQDKQVSVSRIREIREAMAEIKFVDSPVSSSTRHNPGARQ